MQDMVLPAVSINCGPALLLSINGCVRLALADELQACVAEAS